MANNVTAVALGGQPQVIEASTVKEAAEKLNIGDKHTVKVNGESADYSTSLEDYSFVSFGEKVKGGLL